MDNQQLLAAAGYALFGANWKPALGEALDVDARSLRRWLQTGDIPSGVWRELLQLAQERRSQLMAIETSLRTRSHEQDGQPDIQSEQK